MFDKMFFNMQKPGLHNEETDASSTENNLQQHPDAALSSDLYQQLN